MSIEDDLLEQGVWPVCGLDEAGRGPLAGPVVAAAVVLPPGDSLRSIVKDSKKLSPRKRQDIFERIKRHPGVTIGVGAVGPDIIDKLNILEATFLAMKRAVDALQIDVEYALVDGNMTPRLDCKSIPVVKGDSSEPSISAASIVAKVIRDGYMLAMDSLYPGYDFASHKGYPTPMHFRAHFRAIRTLGACPLHRKTFKGVCL